MQQPQGESCENVSFGNDSETLVFGRACDYPTRMSSSSNDTSFSQVGVLPWEEISTKNTRDTLKDAKKEETKRRTKKSSSQL